MSPETARQAREESRTGDESLVETCYRVAFGDRLGLCVFLATVIFGSVFWRAGFVINDNWTVANTLVGVADGHLHVGEVRYAQANSPGMHLVDGKLYGRNYGHVFLALPFLWALEGVATVADPRVAFAALWSLLVLALAVLLGREFDHEREATLAGSALALGAFAANLAVATPLTEQWFALLALEVSTTLASAAVALLLYRLLARMYSRRAGVFAGLATVTATGFGFWASVPKRHAVVAALLLAVLYSLYRSRAASSRREAVGFRALAYAWVGLATWVHAPEAFVVFVCLLAVDLPTARENDPRALAAVGVVFGLSVLPFLATNYLISGNPILPPRLLPDYDGGAIAAGASETPGPTGGTGSASGRPDPNSGGGAVGRVAILVGLFADGAVTVVTEPLRLVGTFLRSGDVAAPYVTKGDADVELAMLETAPLLAGLVALPVVGVQRLRSRVRSGAGLPDRHDPVLAADAFALVTAVALTLAYIHRLPIHAQVGVRYLLPLYALGLYALVRQAAVRAVLNREGRLLCWTVAAGVLVGAQLFLLGLHLAGVSGADLLQAHAYVGLAVASLVAAWTLATRVGVLAGRRSARVGAVVLGVAVAAGVDFLLLVGFDHFASMGDFVLPGARWLALRLLLA